MEDRMKAFHAVAVPHQDILDGKLTMDVFAADLWEVSKNRGPDEYRDAKRFFDKTYRTEGLTNLLAVVQKRLEGNGGDPVIQIQTPFGGGKTHTLIALYHNAKIWDAKSVVIVGTALIVLIPHSGVCSNSNSPVRLRSARGRPLPVEKY